LKPSGVLIKPSNQLFRSSSEDADMGLDMTRSGYRRQEAELSNSDNEDIRPQTPPSTNCPSIPFIPTYGELHQNYSPTSPDHSPYHEMKRRSYSFEEGQMPNLNEYSPSHTPHGSPGLTNYSRLTESKVETKDQLPLTESQKLPQQPTSSSDEEGDETDPIMELSRRKQKEQEETEEVPNLTAVLYTISEEPTPKLTPSGSAHGSTHGSTAHTAMRNGFFHA